MTTYKIRLIIRMILGLSLIQIGRISLKYITFCFLDQTDLTDKLVSAVLMLFMSLVIMIVVKVKKIVLSVIPKTHKKLYIIISIVAFALLISTPIITMDKSFFAISTLIYSAVITPIFEELIFRGYLWNKLKSKFENEFTVYILSTMLFAIWHLGYIDSIAFRVTTGSLPFAMFMKVITGLCFGIVLGFVRYKTKNCYSTILLHGVMNIFGR